jgi:hypothetical protein
MKLILIFLFITFSSFGQTGNNYYLSEKDQTYFKNGANEGSNQFERIEKNVAEINKLHSKINSLETELGALKKKVEELEKRR